MSNWPDIKQRYVDLSHACLSGEDLHDSWICFCEAVASSAANPPYHLRILLDLLDEARGSRPKSEIAILDHGCGGCLSLLYLLARGYEGIHGVDVGGNCENWDRLLNEHLGLTGQRFYLYDGLNLPFKDSEFGFVFSTQVIEHVHDDVLETFYSEERRVLAPGGMAYHQVPHRMVPYDSHTQTWFIHYLPRQVWLGILRRLGRDMVTPEQHLFLRWPSVHRRLARQYLGNYEDRTMDRFVGVSDLSYYEGPKALRRFLSHLLNVPVLGWLGRKVLANLVMLDTVSRMSVSSATNADQARSQGRC